MAGRFEKGLPSPGASQNPPAVPASFLLWLGQTRRCRPAPITNMFPYRQRNDAHSQHIVKPLGPWKKLIIKAAILCMAYVLAFYALKRAPFPGWHFNLTISTIVLSYRVPVSSSPTSMASIRHFCAYLLIGLLWPSSSTGRQFAMGYAAISRTRTEKAFAYSTSAATTSTFFAPSSTSI